jgi:hypothetical protein
MQQPGTRYQWDTFIGWAIIVFSVILLIAAGKALDQAESVARMQSALFNEMPDEMFGIMGGIAQEQKEPQFLWARVLIFGACALQAIGGIGILKSRTWGFGLIAVLSVIDVLSRLNGTQSGIALVISVLLGVYCFLRLAGKIGPPIGAPQLNGNP